MPRDAAPLRVRIYVYASLAVCRSQTSSNSEKREATQRNSLSCFEKGPTGPPVARSRGRRGRNVLAGARAPDGAAVRWAGGACAAPQVRCGCVRLCCFCTAACGGSGGSGGGVV